MTYSRFFVLAAVFTIVANSDTPTGTPAECAEPLGARLWVFDWDESSSVEFGLIAAI